MHDATGRHPPRTPIATLAVSWLDGDQHGSQVLATARHLLTVQAVVQQALPLALMQACKVARIDRQHITLAVPSAAYASKLRQLAPRILLRLKDNGWNLTEMSVRVQGSLQQTGTKVAQRDVVPLDRAALASFEALHQSLEPGPLCDAVKRLLARHRATEN